MSTVSDFISDYQAHLRAQGGLAESTIADYGRDVGAFMRHLQTHWPKGAGNGNLSLTQISPLMLRGYLGHLSKQHRRTTVARSLAALRSFFRYQVKQGRLMADPTELVELHRREAPPPAILSTHALQLFLDRIAVDCWRSARNRAIVEILFATGIRVSELTALTWGDLDFEAASLRVAGRTRFGKRLPVGPKAMAVLQHYADFQKQRDLPRSGAAPLFFNHQGQPLTARAVTAILHRLAVLHGFTDSLTPRNIRRTVAAHLLEAGADLALVQQFMGHKHLTTTRKCAPPKP